DANKLLTEILTEGTPLNKLFANNSEALKEARDLNTAPKTANLRSPTITFFPDIRDSINKSALRTDAHLYTGSDSDFYNATEGMEMGIIKYPKK
ncbi:MAG TPA: hypothetical protein VD770_01645, partial [Coxiellaceae bacterium]|nr:hypothetical protein [Coxiellaceae bacterium]